MGENNTAQVLVLDWIRSKMFRIRNTGDIIKADCMLKNKSWFSTETLSVLYGVNRAATATFSM
jgi:hypothetical protein